MSPVKENTRIRQVSLLQVTQESSSIWR